MMTKENVTMDLEVHMKLTVSKEFLDQFKLDTKGHVFNGWDTDPRYQDSNNYLGSIVQVSCFRNNSRSISHAKVKNIREEQ